ncbi:hypothetical protein NC653_004585 [Populus alba x Populus x berolinensis]|uniref:Uncharacterized protein n=1 Tax=Populus alba x Populus x berolinensis TaxID=444605 RepID=A0AAD6WJI5_9ROSI|nr:hypothetical protein NC653_004574 [Populus alba x Populus x berolinensis]KAJ7015323.1 hypothetical protein NC653_004585 [Populus alba x Populus x berolinensis]
MSQDKAVQSCHQNRLYFKLIPVMPFFVLDFTRCWVVCWPKKDDSRCLKDANEVLKCLGPAALKEVIQTAEKYEACQLLRLN